MSNIAVRWVARGVIVTAAMSLSFAATQALQPISGEVTASDFQTSAASSASEWRAEQVTETYQGYDGGRLALAADGAAVVVWAPPGHVWAKRFIPGVGWTQPRHLGRGSAPRVAMNDRGDIAVVWQGSAHGHAALRVAHRPHAGAWNTATVWRGSARDDGPQVSVGAGGKVTVVVQAATEEESPARAMVFTRVRRWSGPRILSAPGVHTLSTRVVSGPRGEVTVAWTHTKDVLHNRVCTSVSRDGGWSEPKCWRTMAVTMMEMSADDRGRVYVFDGLHVWSRGPGRVWVLEPAPSVQGAARLVVDAAGNGHVVVMWILGCGCSDTPVVLKVSRRRQDGAWSSVHTLPGSRDGDAAISRRGVVTALMNRGESAESETLVVTRKHPRSTWSTPVVLAGETFTFQIEVAPSGSQALWREGYDQGSIWTARRPPR